MILIPMEGDAGRKAKVAARNEVNWVICLKNSIQLH